jgi:DNA-binding transcriptional ArsR family regulator
MVTKSVPPDSDPPVPGAQPDQAGGNAEEERPTPIRDVGKMRALAHPARLTILQHLGFGATATATQAAELVGLTPSATSYHLRALARAGLIEAAPGRGDGRERVWRTQLGGYTVDVGPDSDPETWAAQRELIDTFLVWEAARVQQYLAKVEDEPPEWYSATVLSETVLTLTAEELTQLNEQIQKLIRPYRRRTRTDPPAAARSVSVMFRAFPVD